METRPIQELIKSRQYDKALAACNAALESDPGDLDEVLRLKSWIHTRQGNYLKGIQELELIIQSGNASIADYHSAGFWSLYGENLSKAAEWFDVAIELGRKQDDVWYESSSRFYASFVNMMLNNYRRAEELLEQVDENLDVFVPNVGSVTRNDLLAEIKKRADKI